MKYGNMGLGTSGHQHNKHMSQTILQLLGISVYLLKHHSFLISEKQLAPQNILYKCINSAYHRTEPTTNTVYSTTINDGYFFNSSTIGLVNINLNMVSEDY